MTRTRDVVRVLVLDGKTSVTGFATFSATNRLIVLRQVRQRFYDVSSF
ncbi:MAG: hypothetical protein GY903_19635 [Fuerstiella sp.]|nr:hypothetical protein [Fuerstiella sp.]MCP4856699.1 hypothetical protein [Fuerstiella sp.]